MVLGFLSNPRQFGRGHRHLRTQILPVNICESWVNMVGKTLIVRILCVLLCIFYVAASFISLAPFDPGGTLETNIELLLKPNICDIADEIVILVHSHAANFELRENQEMKVKIRKWCSFCLSHPAWMKVIS